MDKQILAQWFMQIRSHAAKNYESGGWDYFYEAVDFSDFQRDCKNNTFDTYEKAFEFYKGWCELKAEIQKDHDAEADSSW